MQRKPAIKKTPAVAAKKSATTFTMPPASDMRPTQADLEERIRMRAYELYEARGREDGFDQQDWLRAEKELLGLLSRSA